MGNRLAGSRSKSSNPSSASAKGQTPSSAESKRTKDIQNLAEYIKSPKCQKIVLMLGAGVSTSAGIPDFRSPDTGLYSNLARLKLPYPEAVFDIGFFKSNPIPFYTLASELYPGSFRPTPTHSFIKLLSSHNLLHMCFTQNIDTLERRAGVPADKIVEAHGSFATQRCTVCKTPFPDEEMKEIVLGKKKEGDGVKIPSCKRGKCKGLVKPDIVFFGEALPNRFVTQIPTIGYADLLIIIGTSLTVHPFASLADMVDRSTCRRVLINLERVGDLGRRPSDMVLLGQCDEIVRELCGVLGWEEELEREWELTKLDDAAPAQEGDQGPEKKDVVDKLVDEIEKSLNVKEGTSGSSTAAINSTEDTGPSETKGNDGPVLLRETNKGDGKDDAGKRHKDTEAKAAKHEPKTSDGGDSL